MIDLCRRNAIPIALADFTVNEARGADEAFVTGTLGGVTPVRRIDGCALPACPGPITERLRDLYAALTDADAAQGARA